MIEIKGNKIIDLTHTLYHDMPGWPTHPLLSISQLKQINIDGYNVKQLTINTHHGTHFDAPAHMIENGTTLDKVELSKFIGSGIVVNLSYKKDGEAIERDDLNAFSINSDDIVMLYTGWSNYRGFNQKYLYRWPYLGVSGAKYLAEKNIKLIGIDTLSIGAWGGKTAVANPIADTAKDVHEVLLGKNILILEEVANLDQILGKEKEVRAYFVILPLKIKDSDGSPARAIAIL
ncbi:MAG: cyclase family protein [Nitrososphaeria archaeon]